MQGILPSRREDLDGCGRGQRIVSPEMEADMLVLVIVLLVAWLILSIVGFALEGLMWLGIVGVVLFVGTAAVGAIRRKALRR